MDHHFLSLRDVHDILLYWKIVYKSPADIVPSHSWMFVYPVLEDSQNMHSGYLQVMVLQMALSYSLFIFLLS